MPTKVRADPYAGYSFLLTIAGISDDGKATSGSFSEISGIEAEIGVIEYRNGSEQNSVRKLPGLVKYTNISCKRGVTGDLNFWKWIKSGIDGRPQRADGAIILRDEAQAEVLRWVFRRAWPCKFTGPGLNAANNEIAVDTLEICHEGIEIDQ